MLPKDINVNFMNPRDYQRLHKVIKWSPEIKILNNITKEPQNSHIGTFYTYTCTYIYNSGKVAIQNYNVL